jgi:hypothetical protein
MFQQIRNRKVCCKAGLLRACLLYEEIFIIVLCNDLFLRFNRLI